MGRGAMISERQDHEGPVVAPAGEKVEWHRPGKTLCGRAGVVKKGDEKFASALAAGVPVIKAAEESLRKLLPRILIIQGQEQRKNG